MQQGYEKFAVRRSPDWQQQVVEIRPAKPAEALRLVLGLRAGLRLDTLPTPGWPLADVLLTAALFAAKHSLPISPLCAAYFQLLGWRAGHWAHVWKYGVVVRERGIIAHAAVKVVEARKGALRNDEDGEKEGEGPEVGSPARLEWGVDQLAGWWDPITGWRGTSEMSPEDRYWRYVEN
ncbi:hypothetical protein CspHIS471_0107130 [Cutaneotrichosporon sp. HIS471]|nr:hypothetical protein CspHIS471_0107130 [Cutaneotrichosporon sp. HIS471]